MQAAFVQVGERLPFAIVELHPDNGSEFFNWHLVRFWKEKVTGVQLSRSRPSHKNDHRHVEQKNDTLVRQYFGEVRLDTQEQIAAGNRLVSRRCGSTTTCFNRSCIGSTKTIEGDKVRRTWDQARTPYERLVGTGVLSQEQAQRLQGLYEQTNPLQLRQEIYAGLTQLWDQLSMQEGTAA